MKACKDCVFFKPQEGVFKHPHKCSMLSITPQEDFYCKHFSKRK